jgi:hypothetical protein
MSRRREYRRLPGRCRGWFRVSTTWIGPDHLLLVDRVLVSETYRRIYFHDIQAIVTRPTERFLAWFSLLLLGSMGLAALAINTQDGWRVFWAAPAGMVVAALAVHVIRGPTWACHVRTPLQTVELRAQRRRRWVMETQRRLRPRVDEVQGSLSREAILAALAGDAGPGPAPASQPDPGTGPAADPPAEAPVVPAAGPPPIARRETGTMARLLVLGLVAEAGISALQINFHDPMINLVALALFLAEIGLAIGVATRPGGRGTAEALRIFGWTTLGVQSAMFVIGGVVSAVRAVLVGLRAAAEGSEASSSAYNLAAQPYWIVLPWIAVALGLAVWGMFLLRRLRAENESLWLNLKGSQDGAV